MRSVKQILLADFAKSVAYCDEAEYGFGNDSKGKAFAEIVAFVVIFVRPHEYYLVKKFKEAGKWRTMQNTVC